MDLTRLYTKAVGLAQGYTGSEKSYRAFLVAAIKYEDAGGDVSNINHLLDTAEQAFWDHAKDDGLPGFLDKLQHGGAKVFRHGAVFIRPDPAGPKGILPGEGDFTPALEAPRLQNVIRALRSIDILFDDLVLDVGTVGTNQMRRSPYIIVTIPRLNAQIAVANQEDEALFIANPAMSFMNWTLFEKPMAGVAGGLFEHVTRVTHAGNWENRLRGAVLGACDAPGPKVNVDGYVKAHRKSKYPLTDAMVARMGRMYRDEHPKKQYPTTASGSVPHHIVVAVTGDPNWQEETWGAFDAAGRTRIRGLTQSLRKILEFHGCHYNLTDAMVARMGRMYRNEHPEKQYPTENSGVILHHIVVAVTGDPNWQEETWRAVDSAGKQKLRGLTRSLSQTLQSHGYHYNLTDAMVARMGRMYRDEHPKKQYPTTASGSVPHHIVVAVTGDPNWQEETWRAVDSAGQNKRRGLTQSLSKIFDAHDPDRRKKSVMSGSDQGVGPGIPDTTALAPGMG